MDAKYLDACCLTVSRDPASLTASPKRPMSRVFFAQLDEMTRLMWRGPESLQLVPLLLRHKGCWWTALDCSRLEDADRGTFS